MTTPAKPKTTTTSTTQKPVRAKPAAIKPTVTKTSTSTSKKVTNTAAAKVTATKAVKPAKKVKPAKVKMVRDSYSMPESDYAKLIELKKKCVSAGAHIKKSELIRLGIQSLAKLSDAALVKEATKLSASAEK